MSGRKARQARQRERALALLPNPADGATKAARLALELRNRASTTGSCVCGATATILPDSNTPGIYHAVFLHEDDCLVSRHTPTDNVARPKTQNDVYQAAENLGLNPAWVFEGRQLEFECPVCKARGTQARTATRQVELDLLVRCDGCGETEEILWALAGMQHSFLDARGAE